MVLCQKKQLLFKVSGCKSVWWTKNSEHIFRYLRACHRRQVLDTTVTFWKMELFDISSAPCDRFCAFVSQELQHPLESEIRYETWLLNAVKPNKYQDWFASSLCSEIDIRWKRISQVYLLPGVNVSNSFTFFGLWSSVSDILPQIIFPGRYGFEE